MVNLFAKAFFLENFSLFKTEIKRKNGKTMHSHCAAYQCSPKCKPSFYSSLDALSKKCDSDHLWFIAL